MVTRFGLAYALTALLASAASAQPTVRLFDDFEGYADQGAFEAVWTPVAGKTSNFLVTTGPTNNPANDDPMVLPPSGTGHMIGSLESGATRNERTFEATGNVSASNVVSFSFDFFDGNAAASPYRQHSNLQAGTAPVSTNQLVSMGMNNHLYANEDGGNYYMGRILGFTPTWQPNDGTNPFRAAPPTPTSGMFFKLNEGGEETLRQTGWVNLRVDISSDDGESTDYKFYVNDILAKTINNVGTAASIRSYDVVRLGSGLSSGTMLGYTDNVSVVLNPEPIVAPGGDNADFNGDNIVDGNDFLIWQRNFGTGTALAQGDANGNGVVDAADLAVWKGQFGTDPTPLTATVAAIPEPATASLAAVAMLASLAYARRKQA